MSLKQLKDLQKSGIDVYGDLSFRGKSHSETSEQIAFFTILRRDYPHLAAVACHIRNEGKRDPVTAAIHRAAGELKGMPDIVILTTPPMAIELKVCDPTRAKVSDEQIEKLTAISDAGGYACLALGHKAALDAVEYYYA